MINSPLSTLIKSQFKTMTAEDVKIDGVQYRLIRAHIRYDDQCGNGHNSFFISCDAWKKGNYRSGDPDAGGDGICAAAFPALAPFLQWNGFTSEGPLHYIQNTIYLAGDRDCNGRRAGEPSRFEDRIRIGAFPVLFSFKNSKFLEYVLSGINFDAVEVVEVPHVKTDPAGYEFAPKYTFSGVDLAWAFCPFDTAIDAQNFLLALRYGAPVVRVRVPTAFSSGKARELDAARRAAYWPGATADQLCDADQLRDRLPALVADFKAAVNSLGFEF